MNPLRRGLLLGLAIMIALFGLAGAGLAADGPAASPPDPARQILVMLRSPPQHARPNTDYAGSYGSGQARSVRLRVGRRLAKDYGLALVGEWPMPLLGIDCLVMTVPDGQSPDTVAARVSGDPGVSWSEPMHLYVAQGEASQHNDPLYRVQPAATEWRLAELHKISTGRKVRVAVIDSMIEAAHPDLAGQVEVMENFVPGPTPASELHGTGVAGIIAARADNGVGIAGVAPDARLLGLRACWQAAGRTVCDSLSLAKAITFAIERRAQIINMSLSGPPDQLLGKLLDVALARGVVVVGAFDRNQRGGGFPASHAGVVAVAAESDGPPIAKVAAAPGRDVPTTQPGGRWYLVNGSSYAAAHVSGLYALMQERPSRPRRPSVLVLAQTTDAIDACATLLGIPRPCNCNCSNPHEILAAYAK